MNPQSEYEIDDMLAHAVDERDCLTLDPAGEERLAAAIYGMPGMGATMDSTRKLARAIVEELRK